jgi:4-methyl-5(b-hydroxyethyl)-thiazole monophosphate biosynthesis
MKKACVLLAEGFEEVEALTPVDFFRRAGIEVITAGIGGAEIKGSHGIEVRADVQLSASLKGFDCVVVPGGMPGSKNIAASDLACKLIVRSFESGALVAAICAAPVVVLGPVGFSRGGDLPVIRVWKRMRPGGFSAGRGS